MDLLEHSKQIVNQEIRPMIQSDGGDLEVIKLEDGVLYIRFQGACVNCPSSSMTLAFGIEARIKELLPEIISVQQIS